MPLGFAPGSPVHQIVIVVWAAAAAFMGLKGIQYVARVATFLPLIPLVILAVLFVSTVGGVGKFDPKPVIAAGETKVVESAKPQAEQAKVEPAVEKSNALTTWGIVAVMCTYVVGFFATAGAAGCDFGMNNRDANDVQLGGLVGIAGATLFAGGLAILIVAGAHGLGKAADPAAVDATSMISNIMGSKVGSIFMYLLAIAAFPPACFSSFIAANSFKTTLPKVNPFLSCGIGTLVAILLGLFGWAGDAAGVFTIIGASFGPVCGAMVADYLLAGRKWAGPRAGFNPAGWISWVAGFAVGAADFIPGMIKIPCPPVAAFLVGFVLYAVLSSIGLRTRTLDMPPSA